MGGKVLVGDGKTERDLGLLAERGSGDGTKGEFHALGLLHVAADKRS